MPRRRASDDPAKQVEERRQKVKSWGLSLEDYETLIAENPHVYSPVSGFHAEYKLRQLYLDRPEITDIVRPSGFGRKTVGDFSFLYKRKRIGLEVKSLDGASVANDGGDRWHGTFQCNASDKRSVQLPNGRYVDTNCIVAGGWDVLAINLYEFGGQWRFAFACQSELPRASILYAEEDRKYLLMSSMTIRLPLTTPYYSDLLTVLDRVVANLASGPAARP